MNLFIVINVLAMIHCNNVVCKSVYVTTYQSSTWKIHSAMMAIDNDKYTAAITRKQINPYWLMNLKPAREFYIARIHVELKGGGTFEFIIGKSSHSIDQGMVCNKTVIQNESVAVFSVHCMIPLIGNNIWIRKSGNSTLILYEVKIFICSTDESSLQCYACNKDCENYICKPKIDNCPSRCPDGVFRPTCNPCQRALSSINCNDNCQYCLDGKCNSTSGTCFACPRGKYGDQCDVDCPTTCGSGECYQNSGKCVYCPPGLFGDKCEINCPNPCDCTEGFDINQRPDAYCDKKCLDRENSTTFETSENHSNDPDCFSVCNQTMCQDDDGSSLMRQDGCSYCLQKYILDIHGNINHIKNCSIYMETFCKLNCSSPCKTCLIQRKCSLKKRGEKDTLRGPIVILIIAFISATIICTAVAVIVLFRYFRCGVYLLSKQNDYIEDLGSLQGNSEFDDDEEDNGYQDLEMTPKSLDSSMEAIYSNALSQSTSDLSFCKVPIDRFVNLVNGQRHNDRLTEEFKMLPEGLLSQSNEAMKPFNRCLNRFRDLYPYDFNRVVLESAAHGADYINASYVHGYKCENRYVAAQGPFTEQTVINFWRMIWQLNCPTIVMLSQLTDKGVVKYWPDEEIKHGDIHIKTLVTELHPTHTLRTFEISTLREKKEVTQFHFTLWPRKGVPKNISSVFQFREAVRQQSIQSSPIVIHCSGGIGRTGTFMAYDYLLYEAEENGNLDVLSCVCRMRRQRTNVIQSLEQYGFLYDILAESLSRMFVMINEQELYD